MFSKITLLVLIISVCVTTGQAQPNYWDMPTTEYLIAHNKDNFADHREIKNGQVVSQGTVNKWKGLTNTLKSLTDSIDKRLSSFFIITADASTVLASYTTLKDIYAYQKQSIAIGTKYPFTIPVLISREDEIIASASSLVSYLTLIVNSYSDISKMKVSERNMIYLEIRSALEVVRIRCYIMLQQLKQIDFVNVLKGTRPYKLVNNDAQLVKTILKNF